MLVHFWATWCGPCSKWLGALQKTCVKHKGRGLEIAALPVDHTLASAYKLDSMPMTIIVDKDGNIAHVHSSYHDGEEVQLEAELEALF